MSLSENQPQSQQEIEADKRREEARELVLAYKRVFATEAGKRVLADLCAKFGFDKNEHEKSSYSHGMDGLQMTWRDGVKDPIRHILKMRDAEIKPLGSPAPNHKAKSGLAPSA